MLEKILKIFKRKKSPDEMTEEDIERMTPSELYKHALIYNPNDETKIKEAYRFLKDYGNSRSFRGLFINRHIRPYIKK